MSMTWDGAPPPEAAPPGLRGWLRIARRATLIVVTILLGLALLLPLRFLQRVCTGPGRRGSRKACAVCA